MVTSKVMKKYSYTPSFQFVVQVLMCCKIFSFIVFLSLYKHWLGSILVLQTIEYRIMLLVFNSTVQTGDYLISVYKLEII